MQGKKYYSIREVSDFLRVNSYQLRYIEAKLPDLVIEKIKNRRYYTNKNIEILQQYLEHNAVSNAATDSYSYSYNNEKIDNLIHNFQLLSNRITNFLSKLEENNQNQSSQYSFGW